MPVLWEVDDHQIPQLIREIDRQHGYTPDNRIWREHHVKRAVLAGVLVAVVAAIIGGLGYLLHEQWVGFMAGVFVGANIALLLFGLLSAAGKTSNDESE